MQAAGMAYNPAYGQPGATYPTTGYPTTYPTTTPYPGTGATTYPTTTYPTTSYPATASTTYPSTTYPSSTTPYPQAGTSTYPATTSAYPQTATYPQTASTTYPQSTAAYPQTSASTYPQATTTYPTTTYPTTDPSLGQAGLAQTPGFPQATIPTQTVAYTQTAPTAVYDPRTGQMTTAAVSAYSPTPTGGTVGLYAGLAYEVHALAPGGIDTPINAATYTFRSGDQFKVYFRPSMPGHVDVYNINPLGQQKRIDSVDVAAGQLTALGPYQFTATTGDESLRVVLSPCSSNQLMASTRDIINVSATATTGTPLALGSCTNLGSRGLNGIKTRDIEKVAVDGSTSFALDPVTQAELAAGQLAPREVPIYFHHM